MGRIYRYFIFENSKNGKQSRETLQGLAEKNGEKMQESLLPVSVEMVQAIQDGIESVMAPALKKLADETT